jgi:peptidoglycan L-alanyl-D-glutamate endopeptidase CwlK
MNSHSEARLTEVMPTLAEIIRQVAQQCDADLSFSSENATLEVTQGLRTWAEQDALWAIGHTSPGVPVTNAKGGESWHNYGCAVDVAPFINDQQPDWDENHPAWARIVAIGESLGLRSGVSWRDEPHLEMTGKYPADPPQEVKDLYAGNGVQAVWNAITAS